MYSICYYLSCYFLELKGRSEEKIVTDALEEHNQKSIKEKIILALKGQADKKTHGVYFFIVLVYFGIL